jgi:hypothetical protein
MNLKIVRKYVPEQTYGDLAYGDFVCKTLELADKNNQRQISCIPEGSYPYTKEIHKKFGKVLRLNDVPGRDGVLVHYGNYAGSLNPKTNVPDSLGCILVGLAFADIDGDGIKDITSSRPTMDKLYDVLPDKGILTIASDISWEKDL